MDNGFGVSPIEIMSCDAMLKGIVYLDEFTYSASWIAGTQSALTAGTTVEQQILINSDSDFVVQMRNMTVLVPGEGEDPAPVCETCPNYLITLVRAGAGREVMSAPQHVMNYFGNFFTANYPGRLPMPGLLQANNTLTLRLQNLSAVTPVRVDIALSGYKCFYVENEHGEIGTRRGVFHAL